MFLFVSLLFFFGQERQATMGVQGKAIAAANPVSSSLPLNGYPDDSTLAVEHGVEEEKEGGDSEAAASTNGGGGNANGTGGSVGSGTSTS